MRPITLFSLLTSLLFCAAAARAAAPAANEPSAADRQEIRTVIERQLDAFQRDDEVTAFSYASPGIRAQFKTPANFMQMVRASYQAVYRPRAVKFLEPAVIEGDIIQALQVVAPDGTVMVALYTMQRQPDGLWRIAGCMLVPAIAKST